MIESFIRYISYEKRYSQHTLTSYQNDLLQLELFLQEKQGVSDISKASHLHIRAWIISLVENQLKPKSINRKIATLRSFYKFLLKRELIEKDPMLKVKALKSPKALPHFVNEGELNQLLDHFAFTDDFFGLRDRLTLELLYGTGIRLAELINLREDDVNLLQHTIKVLGKRNKERVIPFSRPLADLIIRYKKEKASFFDIEAVSYLIVTDKGAPAYPMFIYRTVKKHLDITTVDKQSPHVLRHTFATHLVNKGADLNAVKDLLGHTSLAATQVYTHNSLDKLRKVFEQAHPKA